MQFGMTTEAWAAFGSRVFLRTLGLFPSLLRRGEKPQLSPTSPLSARSPVSGLLPATQWSSGGQACPRPQHAPLCRGPGRTAPSSDRIWEAERVQTQVLREGLRNCHAIEIGPKIQMHEISSCGGPPSALSHHLKSKSCFSSPLNRI